ncbi:hypothetical protein [Flexivirga oryzae]|uniref:Uncharacterized protein n=1 Tax=Flexivirga oryzae TaxID=1794944 RepID=A0A839NDV4_9MICO|nr:hypothetical protein [Flexivirga oryzae]MBB2893355.1 hypothetical protein [Flexivirga oryzae]
MMSELAPLLQRFFTDKLDRHLNASVHTKAAYADTFRLLLGYAERATGIAPSALTLADLDACCPSLILRMLSSLMLPMIGYEIGPARRFRAGPCSS